MANIKSFPNNQDIYVGAEYVMKWFHGRTSGVFGAADNATVAALSDPAMAVTVSDGVGWISNAKADGVVWWNDSEATTSAKLQLTLDPADGALDRIDRVIVEWKTTNYVDWPEIKVLTGTAKSNPSAPALTNNSTVRQISLARISVPAGTTKITTSMITDERLDSSVCGLVTDKIEVDTSAINAQVQALLTRLEQELANIEEGTACVLKTGDTMTGPLTIPTPTASGHAVNKGYVDTKTVSATLSASGWSDTAPYSQSVTVAGLTDARRAHAHPVYSGTLATDLAIKEACACVSYAKRSGTTVTFYCLEDLPESDIPVEVEVGV